MKPHKGNKWDWSGGEIFVQHDSLCSFTLSEDIEGIGKSGETLQGLKLDIQNPQKFDSTLVSSLCG